MAAPLRQQTPPLPPGFVEQGVAQGSSVEPTLAPTPPLPPGFVEQTPTDSTGLGTALKAHFNRRYGGLVPIARGMKEAAVGTASSIYHAFTDPATPEEKARGTMPGNFALRRLIVDPMEATAAKIPQAPTLPEKLAYGAAAMIPGAGPFAAHLGERIGAGEPLEALGEGVMGVLMAKGGNRVASSAIRNAPAIGQAVRHPINFLRDTPDAVMVNNLKIDPKYAPVALTELKSSTIPVTDVPSATAALNQRLGVNVRAYNELMKWQKDVVEHGSAAAMKQAEIAAIPEYLREKSPNAYLRAVSNIEVAYRGVNDFTRGQLDNIRKSLGAANTAVYRKNPSGRIAADETIKAVDMAAESAARRLLYDAMDRSHGGMGATARRLNEAKGSIIHMRDALKPYERQSFVESGKGPASRVLGTKEQQQSMTSRAFEAGRRRLTGRFDEVNRWLPDVINRWDQTAPPITPADLYPASVQPLLQQTLRPQLPAPPDPSGVTGTTAFPWIPEAPMPPVRLLPNMVENVNVSGTIQRPSGATFAMPESSLEFMARRGRGLTEGQKLLPASTETKVTPLPPESFAEALKRAESPQGRVMREMHGEGAYQPETTQIPVEKPLTTQQQTRSVSTRPTTAEEYLETKGGRKLPEGTKRKEKGRGSQ